MTHKLSSSHLLLFARLGCKGWATYVAHSTQLFQEPWNIIHWFFKIHSMDKIFQSDHCVWILYLEWLIFCDVILCSFAPWLHLPMCKVSTNCCGLIWQQCETTLYGHKIVYNWGLRSTLGHVSLGLSDWWRRMKTLISVSGPLTFSLPLSIA